MCEAVGTLLNGTYFTNGHEGEEGDNNGIGKGSSSSLSSSSSSASSLSSLSSSVAAGGVAAAVLVVKYARAILMDISLSSADKDASRASAACVAQSKGSKAGGKAGGKEGGETKATNDGTTTTTTATTTTAGASAGAGAGDVETSLDERLDEAMERLRIVQETQCRAFTDFDLTRLLLRLTLAADNSSNNNHNNQYNTTSSSATTSTAASTNSGSGSGSGGGGGGGDGGGGGGGGMTNRISSLGVANRVEAAVGGLTRLLPQQPEEMLCQLYHHHSVLAARCDGAMACEGDSPSNTGDDSRDSLDGYSEHHSHHHSRQRFSSHQQPIYKEWTLHRIANRIAQRHGGVDIDRIRRYLVKHWLLQGPGQAPHMIDAFTPSMSEPSYVTKYVILIA